MRLHNVLLGLAYAAAGRYSRALDFAELLAGGQELVDLEAVDAHIAGVRERLAARSDRRPFDQGAALAHLAERDLSVIEDARAGLSNDDLDPTHIEEQLHELMERLLDDGWQLAKTELQVVDDFPGPYAGQQSWAMSCDVSDRRAYGIDIGIYVRRDFLMPLYTPFLAAHELVHQLVGQHDSDHLARGLEDGLGDTFGSIVLGRQLVDAAVAEQMLWQSRAPHPQSQYWRIYGDDLNQALLLHDLAGIGGLEALIREANEHGRGVIKRAEHELLSGQFDAWTSESAEPDRDLCALSRRWRTASPHLVVSPLAYYIAERVELHGSVSALVNDHEIDPAHGEAAVAELQERVFVLFVEGDEIAADETKPLLAAGALRYEPSDAKWTP